MEHPVALSRVSAQAQKVLSESAPPQLKMMAASGLAPLAPGDLVAVLYSFSYGGDEKLKAKARETLGKMPRNVLCGTLEQDVDPAVLDGLARLLSADKDVVERVLLNKAVADSTVVWLAKNVRKEGLLEIIAANEARMLGCPEIIEALYLNKRTRMSTVDRAIELAVRNGLELDGIPTFAEAKAAIEGQLIPEAAEEPLPEDEEFSAALDIDNDLDIDEATLDEILESLAQGEETEIEEEEKQKASTIEASLSDLTVSQKIRMAMLGNATQRSVLIRDSNKLVIMAVLKSPAIGDSEVIRYSKARSLPEEAVRYIASKRDWTKQYQVKLNLVSNPRTPIQEALRFLQHLRPHDVRGIERSRDVPQAIANAAKQLRQKRGR